MYDTDDLAERQQMDEEVRAIEAMPAVQTLLQLPASSTKGAGFSASLWCRVGRDHGGCGKKAEPPVHILNKGRTTLLQCLVELRARLAARHGGACVAAAMAARAAQADAAASRAPHGMCLESCISRLESRDLSAMCVLCIRSQGRPAPLLLAISQSLRR